MTDNSANRNEQGCVHSHKASMMPFKRGARQPLEGSWNREENRGHGQQCPHTQPKWASCVPRAPGGNLSAEAGQRPG